MPPQREPSHYPGMDAGRAHDAARERWRAADMLMAALDRARGSGYLPGSRDMAALADAEARYQQAKADAFAAAAAAVRAPMTLGRFTPMPVAARPAPGRLGLS